MNTDDDSLPKVPLFRLLPPERVAKLLEPANSLSKQSVYHNAPSIAHWGEAHHLITVNHKPTKSVKHHEPPSTPKRRMRHIEEHEHL